MGMRREQVRRLELDRFVASPVEPGDLDPSIWGTPGSIAPDDVAAAGVAGTAARSDHRHGFTSAAAVSIGSANAEGVAATHARSDHTHDLIAGSVQPADLNTAVALEIAGEQVATGGGAVTVAKDAAFDQVQTASLTIARACMVHIQFDLNVRTQSNVDGNFDLTLRVQVGNADHPDGANYNNFDCFLDVLVNSNAQNAYDTADLDRCLFWPLAAGTHVIDLDVNNAVASAGDVVVNRAEIRAQALDLTR